MRTRLAGASACLKDATINVSGEAIEDDVEEELESIQAALEFGDGEGLHKLNTSTKKRKIDTDALTKHFLKASEEVVVKTTLDEYARLWKSFKEFCVRVQYVDTVDKVEELAVAADLPKDFPTWISVWIMDKCDDIDIHTGSTKGLDIPRSTYATGQKMRAALSHKFSRELRKGTSLWMENSLRPGYFLGNPSLAPELAQYMVSLRRRKTRSNDPVTSARAMDEETLRKLYEFNMEFEPVTYQSSKRKAAQETDWAGHAIRVMLNMMYIITFLCLLRYDEALRIQWHWIEFQTLPSGKYRIKLQLPYRKTHQTGKCQPFYLYANDDKPWLCPIRAFARWMSLNQDNMTGFLFRKKMSSQRFDANSDHGMSSSSFLECFRNNLLDISIDPRTYGMHSFRRGGCQYLHLILRWPLREICAWGGWAEDFDNPGTIFKYLLSWTDTLTLEREDYFNPDRKASDVCHHCGRSCWCA